MSGAVDRVERGIEAAMADIENRLDGARRAVVVCLAEDDASCIRGFAGPLDELAECSVEVL
ncbi:MAG: hypothetical protein ABEN55_00820 [Bradymonadaceae bacterium]